MPKSCQNPDFFFLYDNFHSLKLQFYSKLESMFETLILEGLHNQIKGDSVERPYSIQNH